MSTTSPQTVSVDNWAAEVIKLCRAKNFTPDVSLTAAVHRYTQPSAEPGQAVARGVITGAVATADATSVGTFSSTETGGQPVQSERPVAGVVVVPDATANNVSVANVTQGKPMPTQHPALASAADQMKATVTPSFALPPVLMQKGYRLGLPCRVAHRATAAPSASTGVRPSHSDITAAVAPTPGTPESPGTRAVLRESASRNCKASPHCFYGMQTLGSDAQTLQRCADYLVGPCPSLLAATREEMASAIGGGTAVKEACSLEDCRVTPSSVCLWRGLRNLSNTCYFNAIVQLLFSLGPVRRAILSETAIVSPSPAAAAAADGSEGAEVVPMYDLESASELAQSGLKELFAQMAFARGEVELGADPTSFVRYLALDPAVQQDAQEFMALLVDWLRCRCGPAVKATMDNTLGGTYLYDRRCGACGRSVKRSEPFLSLSVPVRATLDEALTSFLTPEEVEGFTCEACGKKATATSYQYLRSLPDVLLIHLNRFEFDMQTLQRRKVNTAMSFPTVLDLTPYERQWHEARQQAAQGQTQLSSPINEDQTTPATVATTTTTAAAGTASTVALNGGEQVYELHGIVNHLGDSAHSGHYTYHGKVRADGSATAAAPCEAHDVWLDFNDANVSPLRSFTGATGSSPDAYILVYRRLSGFPATANVAADTTNPTMGEKNQSPRGSGGVAATAAGPKLGDATEPLTARASASVATTPTYANNAVSSARAGSASAEGLPLRPSTAPRMTNATSYDSSTQAVLTSGSSASLNASSLTKGRPDLTTAPSPSEFPPFLLDYVARMNWAVMEKRKMWRARREHAVALMTAWSSAVKAVMHPSNSSNGDGAKLDELYAVPSEWIEALGRAFLPLYVDVHALSAPPLLTDAITGGDAARANAQTTLPAIWQPIRAAAPLPGGSSVAAAAAATVGITNIGGGGLSVGSQAVAAAPTYLLRGASQYRAAESAARAALTLNDPTDSLIRHEIQSYPLDRREAPFSFTCPHGAIAPWASFKALPKSAVLAIHVFLTAAGVTVGDESMRNEKECQAQQATAMTTTTTTTTTINSNDSNSSEAFLRTLVPFRLCAENSCALCVAATAAKVEQLAQSSQSDAQALELLHEKGLPLGEAPPSAAEETGDTAPSGTDALAATSAGAAGDADGDETAPAASTEDKAKAASEEVYVYVSDDLTLAWETYVETKQRWQRTITNTEGFTAVFMLLRCGEQPAWGRDISSTTSAFENVLPDDPEGSYSGLNGDGNADGANESAGFAAGQRTFTEDPSMPLVGSTVPGSSRNPIHGLIEALAPSASGLGAYTRTQDELEAAVDDTPEVSQQLLCPHGSIRPEATVRVVPERLRQYWLRRLPAILTAENQRGGLVLSASPTWTIDAAKVERYLLPFLPVSSMKQRCPLCVVESVRLTTDRHARRLQQMTEAKQFPTLWRAGHFTSAEALSQLRASLGAELPENTTDEQLLQTHHPNRFFFKQSSEKTYRDFVKRWSANLAPQIAEKEAEVRRLKPAAQREEERDRVFAARVTSRGGRGRGRGRGRGNVGATESANASANDTSATNPDSAVGKLAAAEAALAQLKASLSAASPELVSYYGCLPTWWVARWFAAVRDATQSVQDGMAEEHDRISRMQAGISATAIRERRDAAHNKSTPSSRGGVPPLTYEGWLCPHGGALLDLAWLNPADSFWQGRRSKSAELIWHPEWAVQQQQQQQQALAAASSTTTQAAATTDRLASAPPSQFLDPAVDGRTASWLPPMLVVPMDEFMAVVHAYGDADTISALAAHTTTTTTTPTNPPASSHTPAMAAQEGTSPSSPSSAAALPLLVVERNGVRHLQPCACSENCCESLLATFEENRSYFTRGSLKLNLHIRKSKKNFYDATGTLTSTAPGAGEVGSSDSGVHHYTTLHQLRDLLSEYIMREHGYLVPPEALEIARSRTKPLKRVQPVPAFSPRQPGNPNAATRPSSPASTGSPTSPEIPTSDAESSSYAATPAAENDLESATLFELGIHDGATLFVQLTDSVATACASTVNQVGEREVWQTIPPELLNAHEAGGEAAVVAAAAAAAAAERRAFTETRLGGDAARAVPTQSGSRPHTEEPTGAACPVCTFVNAPGMVVCEMCESPLPC